MYCTTEDLQKRFDPQLLTQLADDDDDGQPDPNILETAITDASAEIDAFLAPRYSVPIDSPPEIIIHFCCLIALRNLFLRRPEAHSPQIEETYQEIRQYLRRIARHELSLEHSSLKEKYLPQATRSPEERTFTPESLEPF